MINSCPECLSPLVRGRCPSCPATRNWWAFVLVLVCAGLVYQACQGAGCSGHGEAATLPRMKHALLAAVLCVASPARAERPIPECAWTPAARLELGRLVQLESTALAEAPTFGWALARRWRGRPAWRGAPFSASVTGFSWILRAHRDRGYRGASPRQRRILREGVPAGVASTLEAWARGERGDGCRGGAAWDWAVGVRGNLRCPGHNVWTRMPAGTILTEGTCG